MTLLRTGIIGLSEVISAARAEPAPHAVLGTRMPYTHASAYAVSPTTQLVAVCDIIPALVDRFRERWGARWPALKTYADYRAMDSKSALAKFTALSLSPEAPEALRARAKAMADFLKNGGAISYGSVPADPAPVPPAPAAPAKK